MQGNAVLHLQFMAHGVPPLQVVTMLGAGHHWQGGARTLTYNVHFPASQHFTLNHRVKLTEKMDISKSYATKQT